MTGNTFKEDGFKLVRGLINPIEVFAEFQNLKKKGSNDLSVAGSKYYQKIETFEKLLEDVLPEIEKHTGYKLYKTYSFARQYELGNILQPHRDRNACEISVTIPLYNEGEPWPIWILDKDEVPQSIVLNPGDALIFKGIQHMHWRAKNVYGSSFNVFLHYVDQEGSLSRHKNDKHRGFGLSFKVLKRHVSLYVTRLAK